MTSNKTRSASNQTFYTHVSNILFNKEIFMFFNFSNPKENKHERVKKAGILILVIIPKLLMKIDNTPITKILNIINGKIILFRFFIEFIIPFMMKNKRKYQIIISGKTKRYLLSSNCHGKGPIKAYIKD